MQAWCAHTVKATDKKGNYIYKRFEDFYTPGSKKSSTLNNNEHKTIQNILKNIKET